MQTLPSDDAFNFAVKAELGNFSSCLAEYGSHCAVWINASSEVFWNITNADTNVEYANGNFGQLLPGPYAVALSAANPNDTSKWSANVFMLNPVGAKSKTGNSLRNHLLLVLK